MPANTRNLARFSSKPNKVQTHLYMVIIYEEVNIFEGFRSI